MLIFPGGSFLDEKQYEELAELNTRAGNLPVDMLFCVPSSLVDQSHQESPCIPARDFQKRDLKVWDGTGLVTRKIPVLDNKQHRFVHYESCRGLEGWITALYGFDELFEEKVRKFEGEEEGDDASSRAYRRAVEWLMIPLTRCISTLVIHLEAPDSQVGKVLRNLAEEYKDFVEWRDGEAAQE